MRSPTETHDSNHGSTKPASVDGSVEEQTQVQSRRHAQWVHCRKPPRTGVAPNLRVFESPSVFSTGSKSRLICQHQCIPRPQSIEADCVWCERCYQGSPYVSASVYQGMKTGPLRR